MLHHEAIPRTPEEIAAHLGNLTENERCMVQEFILGLSSDSRARPEHPPAAERPSA